MECQPVQRIGAYQRQHVRRLPILIESDDTTFLARG